jgi:superfamily I DNA and/or RNA helicase
MTVREDLRSCARLLDTQYRMNAAICRWASEASYDGKLQSADGVASHQLQELLPSSPRHSTIGAPAKALVGLGLLPHGAEPQQQQKTETEAEAEAKAGPEPEHENARVAPGPLLLIDTAGCQMHEDSPGESISFSSASHRNQAEAQVVRKHVDVLLALGLRPSQVGVITPYNGQLELLREQFENEEVSTHIVSLLSSSPLFISIS